MKLIRVIFSVLIALLATVVLMFGTSENGHKIDGSFRQAAAYVDSRIAQVGHPPTPAEFEAWAATFPSKPYTINGIRLELLPYSSKLVEEYGQPPPNGYVLSYWRGEWEESYVSWTKQSTVEIMFESASTQAAVSVLFALCLGFAAFKFWPRRQHAI